MESHKIDGIIKEVLQREQQKKEECPSEEMIASFIDRHLPEPLVEKVEKHLAQCSTCRLLVCDLVKIEEPVFVKDNKFYAYLKNLTQSLLNEVGTIKDALEVSLVWIKGQLSLLRTNGNLNLNLSHALVRNSTTVTQDSIAPITKKFPEFEVSIQINGHKDNLCDIWLNIYGDKIKNDPLRMELMKDQKILQAHPIKNGKIRLEEISPAKYNIRIRKKQNTLANLYLHIKQN
jgi:hypothetical protein